MDNMFIENFLSSFDDSCFPEGFLQDYEPMECLSHNHMGETLLVRDRKTSQYYVAKCYADQLIFSGTNERELLKELHYEGLPAFIGEYQKGESICIVREYVEGLPLNQFVKESTPSESQVIFIIAQLCDILSYLHGHTPPIIHRDIKPQNIIINNNGKIKLIDFGISRFYDKEAKADTVFFGTQEFSPPEQYGFSQTDCRSDIFSLGVVLCWLLTGETDAGNALSRIQNRRLAGIVEKCTAFAPKDRYRDAASVRCALENADGHKGKKLLRICCAVLVLLIAMTSGFVLGRFTDIRPPVIYDNRAAVFDEPIIEQAVKLQLGKTDGETVLLDELSRVTELYLCSDQTAKTWVEYNSLCEGINKGTIRAGNAVISTLKDITKLKNLKKLSLANQDITDISELSELMNLTFLELGNCPIEDISPIGGLTKLTHLALGGCPEVRDISSLANCKNLRELVLYSCRADDFSMLTALGDIEYMHVQDVEPDKFLPYLRGKTVRQLHMGFRPLPALSELAEINGLQELKFDQMQFESLLGIDCLSGLTNICILGMPDLDLSPLKTLPYLKTVTVSKSMGEAAKAIAGESKFEIIYQ